MTTALAPLNLGDAAVIAEDLPDHTAQLALYERAGLEARDAFFLETCAARIITIGRQGILQIGQELLQARQHAQHGTWSAFLIRAGVEERTALNYMRVAEQFGDKPDVVNALPSSALYAMAAPGADPGVVEGIVEEVRSGAPVPTAAEVKQRLAPPPPPRPAPPPVQLTPRPAPVAEVAGDEEIAVPATPRPLPTPLMITPLPVAPTADRKLLYAKRLLLSEALQLLDDDIAGDETPQIVFHADAIASAARMFLAAPALNGAAAMLALSARVEG